MYKRFAVSVCVLLLVILSCFYTATNTDFSVRSAAVNATTHSQVIIIDAGHGGFDGGAVAKDGTLEKDLNLEIALKFDSVLRSLGYKTVLVRNDDSATNDPDEKGVSAKVSDIKYRVSMMEKYPNGIFVSIHMNKFSTTQPHGAQVFYAKTDGAEDLARCLQNSVATLVQTDNKRVIKPTTKDIYLLYHATIPAVIVECGFLSNPAELSELKNEEYQLKIASSLALGIIDYYK